MGNIKTAEQQHFDIVKTLNKAIEQGNNRRPLQTRLLIQDAIDQILWLVKEKDKINSEATSQLLDQGEHLSRVIKQCCECEKELTSIREEVFDKTKTFKYILRKKDEQINDLKSFNNITGKIKFAYYMFGLWTTAIAYGLLSFVL